MLGWERFKEDGREGEVFLRQKRQQCTDADPEEKVFQNTRAQKQSQKEDTKE